MCQQYSWNTLLPTPQAKQIPYCIEQHQDKRTDMYYWMNDYFKQGPLAKEAITYLEEENTYCKEMMKDTETLQSTLFLEMKSRIKEEDLSIPTFINGYYYYIKHEVGKEYPIYCRKKDHVQSAEEVILNVNDLAEGLSYCDVDGLSISPNNQMLVYGIDTVSRMQYTLKCKNLYTGETHIEEIINTAHNYIWSADSTAVYYIEKNEQTLLTEKFKKHIWGNGVNNDILLFHEQDNSNFLSLYKSKSKQYIFFISSNTMSTEIQYMRADSKDIILAMFQSRIHEVLYEVDHHISSFYILTNWNATNFRLMETPEHTTQALYWKEIVPHRMHILLEGFQIFKDFLVLSERKEGLVNLTVTHLPSQEKHDIFFEEQVYDVYYHYNNEFNNDTLRFTYTSLITPLTTYEYHMCSKERKVLKQQEVVGGYEKTNFVTERLYAYAKDGNKIPISIVYKKKMKKNGSNPLLLYGYGAYGVSIDASFSSNCISLLERGFIYAIAHIRGGNEMGRQWYEDGKLKNKINTFTDFITCAEFLIQENYTSSSFLYAQGGSAGGLLIGAIANMRPSLCHGIIAQVPFVDVITTMLDSSIPLTTNEYSEWGNPLVKEDYFYMKSYSPYDNVTAQDYPHILVTTGLHDSQVQYFEPEKWVAKLRQLKTGQQVLLFYTNLAFGHSGASGRFDYLKEIALMYAFLIKLSSIKGDIT